MKSIFHYLCNLLDQQISLPIWSMKSSSKNGSAMLYKNSLFLSTVFDPWSSHGSAVLYKNSLFSLLFLISEVLIKEMGLLCFAKNSLSLYHFWSVKFSSKNVSAMLYKKTAVFVKPGFWRSHIHGANHALKSSAVSSSKYYTWKGWYQSAFAFLNQNLCLCQTVMSLML